jgi:NADH-ubiquinone oxidoreductase chain 4L
LPGKIVNIIYICISNNNLRNFNTVLKRKIYNCTLLFLVSSFNFDDNIGQTFGIYIIAIAGAESVIGLSILIAYYRLKGNISLKTD